MQLAPQQAHCDDHWQLARHHCSAVPPQPPLHEQPRVCVPFW
jgi:hypothetical protein